MKTAPTPSRAFTPAKPRSWRSLLCTVLAVQWLLTGTASATLRFWNFSVTDDWFNGGAWSGASNVPPTPGDDARINNGGTAWILSSGAVVNNIDLGTSSGSSGNLLVSGGSLASNGFVTVGNGGVGVLTIQNGGVVNVGGLSHAILANNLGATGTLNIGAFGGGTTAGALNAATIVGAGTAVINFNQTNSTSFTTQINGSIAVNQRGSGTTTLSGANSYTGATHVSEGTLVVDGSIAASALITVDSGAALGGHGIVSALAGAGTVAPGNSPGILEATHVDPSGGLDFAFQFTQLGSPDYSNASASGNDVLHLTGLLPFDFPLNNTNTLAVDFTGYGTLLGGEVFRGGFYADFGGEFISQIEDATFSYTGLGVGQSVIVDTVQEQNPAIFNSGSKNGYVTQFTIINSVPEPSRALLLVMGLSVAVLRRRRKQ